MMTSVEERIPRAVQNKFNELCNESAYPEDSFEEFLWQALEVDDEYESWFVARSCIDQSLVIRAARELIINWNKTN